MQGRPAQGGAVGVGLWPIRATWSAPRLIVDGLPDAWQSSTNFPNLFRLQDLLDLLKNRVASIFCESLQAQLEAVVPV